MNDRQIAFVRLLLEHNDFVPLETYAESLGISGKTVRRELPSLQQELASFGAHIEKKPGVGIRLNPGKAGKGRLSNSVAMSGFTNASYPYAAWMKRARRMDIALNLLLYSDETTSLSLLAYKYYTGKSSIHNDLKALESFFNKHVIQLQRSPKGTGIIGNESNIREALVDLLVYLSDNNIDSEAKAELRSLNQTSGNTPITLLSTFTADDLSFVEAQVNEVSRLAQYLFDDRDFIIISMRLLVAIYRIREGFCLQPDYPDSENNPFIHDSAVRIAQNIETHYKVQLPEKEIAYLYYIFSSTSLAMQCAADNQINEADELTATAFSEDFWDAFSVVTGINLRKSPSRYSSVILHITHMLHRAKLNMPVHNPIMDILYQDYKGLVNVCQIICWLLTKKLNLPNICMDEICYLVLYIQGELLANEEKAHILLVSNTPQSVMNLMKQKILSRHPRWTITCSDYAGYLSSTKSTYDLVVSTAVIERDSAFPHVFVSPALGNGDFLNMERILSASRHDSDNMLLELIRTVHDISDIGCVVNIIMDDVELIPKVSALTIIALKGIEFIYCPNTYGQNSCDFIMDKQTDQIKKVVINMCECDYMLFTSKLVYQLDNYPETVVEEFVNYLKKEMSLCSR